MPPYRAPASASSHPPTRVGRYSFSNMQAPRPTFDCFGFGPTPPPPGGGGAGAIRAPSMPFARRGTGGGEPGGNLHFLRPRHGGEEGG